MTLVVLRVFFFCLVSLCSLIFPPRRPYAGLLFLVFVLFRPSSSYLFLFSTYVVLLAAFLILLYHILQNSCRFFFVFVVVIFVIFLVWLVLLCCRTRDASISLALP